MLLYHREDWIRTLTDAEYELLCDKDYRLEPRDIIRTDGSIIPLNHVKPYPRHLAPKIDRARGRAIRLDAQWVTIDTWLQEHGLPVDPRQGADRKTFNTIIRKARNGKSAPTERRRGPKPKILPGLMAAMKADILSRKLSPQELEAMPDKELADRYPAKRERVRAARQAVIADFKK